MQVFKTFCGLAVNDRLLMKYAWDIGDAVLISCTPNYN